MRQPFHSLRAAALACALCSASLGAFGQASGDQTVAPAVAHKQKAEIAKGDPARWYRADRTNSARMRTLQKEIAAAYSEAKTGCNKGAKSSRSSCLKDARITWQRDMKNAPAQLAAAPNAETLTRIVTTMEPAQAESSMTGSSQAGQTQSGGMEPGQSRPEMVTEKAPHAAPAPGQPGKPIDDTSPKPPQQY